MQLEMQSILNLAIGAVGAVATYLFVQSSNHEKRIQKIEDVQGIKIDELKKDFEEMERKIDKLTENVSTLSANVHKSKNEENALNTTLQAILKYLNKED